MVHFISVIETEIGRSMESIAAVNFLTFPVSFDLLDKGMDFGLKSKKGIIWNLLIQLVYAFFLVHETSEH